MNILVLSRQQAALAPFHDWLGPAISHARLFTTPDQASGHSGFAEIRTFEAYETTALIDLEVVRLHRTWPIDRIIATSEVDILRAGRLRTRLGLAGQSGPSALAFRNKIVMKQYVAAAATLLRVPRFQAIDEAQTILDFIETHGYPVIIKPDDGSGSRGTHIIRDETALAAFLKAGVTRGLEIEQFITGDQYHIDGLVIDDEVILCWPSKYVGDCLSYTKESFTGSHLLAPDHPLTMRLIAAAREVLRILPTPQSTSFHLEVFHTPDDQLFFCEIASRTGGGLVNATIEEAFGLNLNRLFVQAQADMPIAAAELRARARAPQALLGWGLVPPQAGVFLGARHQHPDMPWVRHFAWTLRPGTKSHGAQLSVDQVANFMVEFGDQAGAEERLVATWQWATNQAQWEVS